MEDHTEHTGPYGAYGTYGGSPSNPQSPVRSPIPKVRHRRLLRPYRPYRPSPEWKTWCPNDLQPPREGRKPGRKPRLRTQKCFGARLFPPVRRRGAIGKRLAELQEYGEIECDNDGKYKREPGKANLSM